jgi:hypothetical protein
MEGSQPTDSGNELAVIEPIAGISLPMQFKQMSSGMPMSAHRQWRDCHYKSKFKKQVPFKFENKIPAVQF